MTDQEPKNVEEVIELAAEAAYEVLRAYGSGLGEEDTVSWYWASQSERDDCIAKARLVFNHPELTPISDNGKEHGLPPRAQQIKDFLFDTTVRGVFEHADAEAVKARIKERARLGLRLVKPDRENQAQPEGTVKKNTQ